VTRAEGPLVSLIMPVWRPRREWFQAAVRSALGQRDCETELIIVDDGNPAPVAELLTEIRHPALRLHRVEHSGPSHARNVGIGAARGRLLRFVDADDVYEPESTARLARLIDADDVIAYGATVFCDEQLRPVWTMSSHLEGSVAPQAMLCRFSVRIQSLLFPRAVVDAAGPWDISFVVCGDLDFIVRATEHGRVRGDPAVATYYRKHGGSVSSDVTRGDEGIRRMMERYVERHPDQRGASIERRAAAARHAVSARAYASRGLLAPSLQRLFRSVRLDPRAAAAEATAALPAAWGHLRHALSPRPSPTLQLDLGPNKRHPVRARSDALS
jgi:glycosyltransferase involved in cell wall biosynthesis